MGILAAKITCKHPEVDFSLRVGRRSTQKQVRLGVGPHNLLEGFLMLVEIAIGDAYGSGFEFSDKSKIDANNFGRYFVGHDLGIPAGKYTDDTQMSISIAEMLISGEPLTIENFAEAFIRTFKRDKRQGYAKKFQNLIEHCNSGTDLLKDIKPESTRNGAAMRSVPLGLIQNRNNLLSAAKIQASITHNTKEGIISSQIVALAAHELIYKKVRIKDIPKIISTELGFPIDTTWDKPVDCDAIQTINAVFSALINNTDIDSLLVQCINFSGDVDSVAAIALGLASLSPEYTNNIHPDLINTIENGAYGIEYLRKLDGALNQLYPSMSIC